MSEDQQLSISLRPEPINLFGIVTINNSLFTMLIVMVILAILIISALGRPKLVGGRWQGFWELVVETLLNLVENSLGRTKTARRLFPLVATFFIFILFANWFSLIPGVGSVGYERRELVSDTANPLAVNNFAINQGATDLRQQPSDTSPTAGDLGANDEFIVKNIQNGWAQVQRVETEASTEGTPQQAFKPMEGAEARIGWVPTASVTPAKPGRIIIPIIRPPNADLNMTLSMALIAVITANIVAIISHGVGGWLKEFFPKPYVMDPLLTPIEIISQFSRIISLTFRLFGNIFAGEALLAVILKIAAPVLVVFLGLELFFGFIQALVFFSLSVAYMTLAYVGTGEHGETGHEGEEHAHGGEGAFPTDPKASERESVGAV